MKNAADITPAMKQYLALKEQYRDCILFFRMGDFYEMFFDDAVVASKVLEITLTSRNKNREDSIPLCGVPYHAASAYIAKLIEKGFKVAVCEQMEDPKLAKGVVKRDVVRVVTPGLVVDPENLDAKENNFLGALFIMEKRIGLAFLDISTGEFRITESGDRDIFLTETSGINLRELLIPENSKEADRAASALQRNGGLRITGLSHEYFNLNEFIESINRHFPEQSILAGLQSDHPAAAAAACAVLMYALDTQKENLSHIGAVEWYEAGGYLMMDDTAKANLELFFTIAEKRKAGSLFHVLDHTVTAMGGRRLRWWLNYPLLSPAKINERLDAVSKIREQHLVRDSVRKMLAGVYDMERLGARISMGVANARDLVALKTSLQALPGIKAALAALTSPLLSSIYTDIDEMQDINSLIENSIVPDPPMTIREGGIIKEGYETSLDELISVSRDGKRWIAALEDRERKRTGINTLKVGFNSVFGYYIEVTKANAASVPDDYIRKQTLVNAERYINQELKGYEHTVLNAEDRRCEKEYDIFISIRNAVAAQIKRLQTTASHIADLDALAALAEVAEKHHYCRPEMDDGDIIDIRDGRHPVVERMNPADGFVANDVMMDLDKNRFLIITGPNMAGKSTFIRQTALIVLLAQMGSFVPASSARIGVVDRIFTRIGAADSLSKGHSTFMVEMSEVASILKNATTRSLIILDEVGRGTSTFDGLSIAWAVAEYIHDHDGLGSRTLFATHYHELTELALTKDGVKNFNIAVKEWGERIIFLRKIMEGGTNRSYGIQVARIAGVPDEVIARSKEVLRNLEKGEFDSIGMPKIARGRKVSPPRNRDQLSLFMEDEDIIINELQDIDLMNLTPLDAINRISIWKDKLNKGKT